MGRVEDNFLVRSGKVTGKRFCDQVSGILCVQVVLVLGFPCEVWREKLVCLRIDGDRAESIEDKFFGEFLGWKNFFCASGCRERIPNHCSKEKGEKQKIGGERIPFGPRERGVRWFCWRGRLFGKKRSAVYRYGSWVSGVQGFLLQAEVA
jgi:hypothetical protein